jgi:ABC-type transport system involved in cytochrome c biogenesis permease subunit
MLKTILKPFASLTLTVILLALSMILIYAGTWAQIDSGIWQVQRKYFHSFFCWIDFQTLLPRPQPGQKGVPGGFPMFGGYAVGLALLINLLTAHALRFKFVAWDLVLLPLLGLMIGGIYFWHLNPSHWYLIFTIAIGVVFLFALALLHGKRSGVILIHLGLIALLAGEGITSGMASESNMTIDVGSYAQYSADVREPELAIVDRSAPDQDRHWVVSAKTLRQHASSKNRIDDARLPFEVTVDAYFANSGQARPNGKDNSPTIDSPDVGTWTVVERPVIGGVVGNASDAPSAFVTLSKKGQKIGSFLVTLWVDKPQPVTVDGKAYDLSLRWKRIYHPYTVKLLEFVHDKYVGTTVAKDFASHVILEDPAHNETREVRIWMNNPLRYRGDTLFQSSFKPGDQTTILQVVRNPGATLPYVAIIIATVGLLLHFGIALATFLLRTSMSTRELLIGAASITLLALIAIPAYFFLGLFWTWMIVGGTVMLSIVGMLAYFVSTRSAKAPPPLPGAAATARGKVQHGRREIAPQARFLTTRFLLPAAATAVFGFFALKCALSDAPKSDFDLDTYAKLPISFEGRAQPIDSLARNTLKVISGYASTSMGEGKDKRSVSAIEWYLDITSDVRAATKYKIFRIDHPDIKDLIGAAPKQKYFSFDEIIRGDPKKVEAAIHAAMLVDPKERSVYQKKLAELGGKMNAYINVQRIAGVPPGSDRRMDPILAAPPLEPGQQWSTLVEQMMERTSRGAGAAGHPAVEAFADLQQSYLNKDAGQFNRTLAQYDRLVESKLPSVSKTAAFETWFNRFDPIWVAWIVYIGVFVFAVLSWVGWSAPLQRASFWLLLLALLVHTVAIFARVYISGRPPVTNLANSAVFIGYGAALFAAALELIFPRAIGTACAGLIGCVTLLIYHELALEGDTMKVLVAVLDTNVWLATHVIAITLGYSATFLAGILGIVYICLGLFTKNLDPETRKALSRMMYGITCFALLFSFVGTILGGIWADQSWGRFWGWDPKENGAVLIVLANAIFLHARWGGLVKDRGMACLAIFGNIITAWSWFGTNMLGVGLHSYGFMDSALIALLAFVGSQLLLIGAGAIPLNYWKSFRDQQQPPAQPVILKGQPRN